MKIAVVGGAGYVGGAVTDLLACGHHDFIVYDSLVYEDYYFKDVEFVFGDIRDHEKLKPILDRCDAVIWLAAAVGDGACAKNPDVAVEVNDKSVLWLSQHFDGRIVYPSTCSVYGVQEGIVDETASTKPLSVYAATKLAAENHLKDKNSIIFRLGTLFGMSDRFSRLRVDLVVNTMTVRAWQHNKISVYGGAQYRPLLHVKDVAKILVDSCISGVNGVYNLHSVNMKMSELADLVAAHFPGMQIERTEISFEDSRSYQVNSDLARSKAWFDPVIPVAYGIDEIRTALMDGRIKNINNPRYVNQQFFGM